MEFILQHSITWPILLPMIAAAALLLFDDRRHKLKSIISISSMALLIVIGIMLMVHASDIAPEAEVYRLGNWPSPFSIVLVLDQLAALMVLLSGLLGLASLVYAQAHWHTAGPQFHSLFQMLIAGVNGAFLTGDIFNLFVFFEVLLTASYGLMLHSTAPNRVRAGLHYVVANLVASSLFLIGAAMLYGVSGTLNMAHLAERAAELSGNDLVLFQIGTAILAVAFLLKAGMWPLNFWLPSTYSAAVAPVGAIFAILSKVGIYVILRLSLLVYGAEDTPSFAFGNDWLFYGGLITLIFGMVGVLASQALGRLAAYCILISSGTLLACIGLGNETLIAAAIFYLISSTIALSAFFLLVELVERSQDTAANVLAVTMEVYGEDEQEEEQEIGFTIPAALAILGACFGVTAILIIGMPPFSGFLAKFMMVTAIFGSQDTQTFAQMPDFKSWILVATIIISGIGVLIAMSRAGIRTFWASLEGKVPTVQIVEIAPIIGLLCLCLLLTVAAGPVMHYIDQTNIQLHSPFTYIQSVLGGAR